MESKKVTIRMRKIARKKAFAEFVAARCVAGDQNCWKCCNHTFVKVVDIHKHVSHEHSEEINIRTKACLDVEAVSCVSSACCTQSEVGQNARKTGTGDAQAQSKNVGEAYINLQTKHLAHSCTDQRHMDSVCPENCESARTKWSYSPEDVYPWLPAVTPDEDSGQNSERCDRAEKAEEEWQVLLFYRYTELADPQDICQWQRELCRRLQLSGKIRIAKEGLNGTVGGPISHTEHYIRCVISHPSFNGMTVDDFKTSAGGRESFPAGLTVSVHQEIVPMGVDPQAISFKDAGNHLTPAKFHEELEEYRRAKDSRQETDSIFIDCRNFYESKIGAFHDAIRPDIRKFSYWPEYVDRNEAVFADKKVLMYCTGGIRCERGSAYLRSKGICKEVLQLEGGIHRYIEQYPDGYFRGKLFVFDDRYSIQTNQDVISACFHCSSPWDQYQPCSSDHCHQLVLSCPACWGAGLSTCCQRCAELATEYSTNGDATPKKRREECSCTANRPRIPIETAAGL